MSDYPQRRVGNPTGHSGLTGLDQYSFSNPSCPTQAGDGQNTYRSPYSCFALKDARSSRSARDSKSKLLEEITALEAKNAAARQLLNERDERIAISDATIEALVAELTGVEKDYKLPYSAISIMKSTGYLREDTAEQHGTHQGSIAPESPSMLNPGPPQGRGHSTAQNPSYAPTSHDSAMHSPPDPFLGRPR
nr:hypothetical protein L204_04698 [Cryptococcus depauperatus CBS 7855]